jgi:hypothetical protein
MAHGSMILNAAPDIRVELLWAMSTLQSPNSATIRRSCIVRLHHDARSET